MKNPLAAYWNKICKRIYAIHANNRNPNWWVGEEAGCMECGKSGNCAQCNGTGRLLRVGVLHAVEQAGATGATERESPPTRFLTRYQIGRNGYSNLSGNKLWRQTVPSQFASSTHMDGNGVIRTWPSVPAGLRIKGFGRTSTSPSAPSKNATTSGSTRPRPRKTSHEIPFSARLSGTSFKSALPGRQIGSRTWSGAG